jgi:HD-like signal output (HDOD) protein
MLLTTRLERPASDDLETALHAAAAGEALELPPLPQVAVQVAQLAAAEPAEGAQPQSANAAALAELIQRDVALAGQVMRVANSALYSRRAPVVSLPQAIAWLGFDSVRNIALSFALRSELFVNPAFEARMKALWRESVTVACLGREIARATRRNVELAYLCGLLHRVGLAVILWRLANADPNGAGPAEDDAIDTFAAGFEGRVGGQLARVWNLPPQVGACIVHWRQPLAARDARPEVMQLAVARALAGHLTDGAPEPALVGVPAECLEEVGLYPEDIAALLERREAILATVESYS